MLHGLSFKKKKMRGQDSLKELRHCRACPEKAKWGIWAVLPLGKVMKGCNFVNKANFLGFLSYPEIPIEEFLIRGGETIFACILHYIDKYAMHVSEKTLNAVNLLLIFRHERVKLALVFSGCIHATLYTKFFSCTLESKTTVNDTDAANKTAVLTHDLVCATSNVISSAETSIFDKSYHRDFMVVGLLILLFELLNSLDNEGALHRRSSGRVDL
mmetsp:Transcript_12312/g.23922  ORF Transcript_12312/g.23922 Transcript_12312/m.23922 type:complete len:214 (+) Transcript_12312:172-813(+)